MIARYGGLIELLVVTSVLIGWGVLELVVNWLDRRRSAEESTDPARHPKRQQALDPGAPKAP